MQNHGREVQAYLIDTEDALLQLADGDLGAGAIHIRPGNAAGRFWLSWICPCGCRELNTIPVRSIVATKREGERGWTWDGNTARPTIDPSIRRLDRCKWHGYLQAGIWKPCGDSGQ